MISKKVLCVLVLGVGIYWRSQTFVYRNEFENNSVISSILKLGDAESLAFRLHLFPNPVHLLLRGRVQKFLDYIGMLFGGITFLLKSDYEKLSLYLNPPETSILDLKYDTKPTSFLDIFLSANIKTLKERNRSVIIFCHGGAWGSGSKYMYRALGANIAKETGALAVNVGYGTYPTQDAWGQIEDIQAAINWVIENISKYGGDPEKIYLSGHSSGAHISVMALINVRKKMCSKQLENIKAIIPISGVYHIWDHYLFERSRGVEKVSTMKPACGYTRENFNEISPTEIVKQLDKDHLEQLPPFYFIHGERDTTVPYHSTLNFVQALRESGLSDHKINLTLLENGGGHAEIVTDAMGLSNTTERVALVQVFQQLLEKP